jgi:nucleotide-binding universal stress UspA family protein
MHVVKTPIAQGELGYTFESADLREKAQQEALNYLNTLIENRGKQIAVEYGVKVTWSVAMAKDVADTLIQEAELGASTRTFEGYDLMALATHGQSGFQHWTMGTITERVLGATKLPLFVVRPQEQGTSDTSLPMKEEAITQ